MSPAAHGVHARAEASYGTAGPHPCFTAAVGGRRRLRRVITASTSEQVPLAFTSHSAGRVWIAVGGAMSERVIVTASTRVTRPSPFTSPH